MEPNNCIHFTYLLFHKFLLSEFIHALSLSLSFSLLNPVTAAAAPAAVILFPQGSN